MIAIWHTLSDFGKHRMVGILRALHNSFFRHSGLDPESRKYLKTLDSGFRRNDEIVGFMLFCKGLILGSGSEAGMTKEARLVVVMLVCVPA
jgi:hypothetical protein